MGQINKVNVSDVTYDISQSPDATFTATSNDNTSPTSWTDVAVLASGETNSSIFSKISSMFKNIRFLYSKLGTSDFSSAGDTVSAALAALESGKSDTDHTHDTATVDSAGFMPALNGNSAMCLLGDGTWGTAGSTYATVTTAAPGLAPTLSGDADTCLLGDGTWGTAGSTYAVATTSTNGLMSSTDKFKSDKLTGVYSVKGTQTETTGAWTGNIDVPALYDGLTIAYYLPRTGSGEATLNLTLSDGTQTGPINCYFNSTSRLTTHYDAGSTIILTYWSAGSISVNGTATTDNRWTHADYNSNTTYATFTSAANGLVPAAKSGTTNWATSGYVLTGAGWAAGTKYNTDTNTTYATFTSAANGLVPAAKSGTTSYLTSAYVLTGAGWKAGTKYNTDNNTTYAFSNGNPTLSWGNKSTVGTVGGVALTVTMPANPNTNTTYGTNVGCYGTLDGTTLTLNTRNFRV